MEVLSLIELCRVQLKVVQLTSSMSPSDLVGLSEKRVVWKLFFPANRIAFIFYKFKFVVAAKCIGRDTRYFGLYTCLYSKMLVEWCSSG